MHGCCTPVRERGFGDRARGRAERLVSVHPYPGRHALAAAQPAGQLELHDRAGEELRRAAHRLAARPHAGRLVVDQRHALRARCAGRLRRLGADGLPGLELGRRAALLQEVRALCAEGRRRGARPGRPAQGRGLPHHPAAHPQIRRGRAAGGLPVQSRPQRQATLWRRLLADDAPRPLARFDRADFFARGAAAPQPARRDQCAGRQAPVRGQALHGSRISAQRQPHHRTRQP